MKNQKQTNEEWMDPGELVRMEKRQQRRIHVHRCKVAIAFLAAIFLAVIALLVVFLLEKKNVGDLEANDGKTWQEPERETMTFLNAGGVPYEMEIDPEVLGNPYDNNGFQASLDGVMTYQGNGGTCLQGIDVSSHQGEIDWEAVREDGIDFVFLRIGYRGYTKGKLMQDERFEANLTGARAAGLKVGVYFFAQAMDETEAAEEAESVLYWLAKRDLQLPVVYDPERILRDVARTDDVTGEQFTRNALVFAGKIKEAGYEPAIYANMYWEAFEWDLKELAGIPIWYADYHGRVQTPYHFTWWQYTDTGLVKGISTAVDRNLWLIQE